MASRSGNRSSSLLVAAAPPVGGEVAVLEGIGGQPARGQRSRPTGRPVDRGDHVGGTGDGADPAPAPVEQVRGREPSAQPVVGVDVAELVRQVPGPADEDTRHPGRQQHLLDVVDLVMGDHDGTVDVSVPQVADRPVGVLSLSGHQQHQLKLGLPQRLPESLDDLAEEGIARDPVVRLGNEQRDRVRPVRHQGPGGPVGGELAGSARRRRPRPGRPGSPGCRR